MNKFIYFFLFLLFSIPVVFGQEIRFDVVKSTETELYVRVEFPHFHRQEVSVEGNIMNKLSIPGAYPVYDAGAPELLHAAKSIIIPGDEIPEIEILESDYRILPDFELAPSRGKIYRNTDPDTIPYKKGEAYSVNDFFPLQPVHFREPYTLRDLRGASLSCYPYSYNPVRKELKVYSSLLIKISFDKETVSEDVSITPEFDPLYQTHFLNYDRSRYRVSAEQGEMLIISPQIFANYLEPLKEWKIRNGIPTEIVLLEDIGNTASSIKDFIAAYYNTHPLVYLILVGDAEYLSPYFLNGEISDNYYTEIVGEDAYPDIFLGRFSVETEQDIEVHIRKIISYEEDPPAVSHFATFCGIASSEGPGDNFEYDWEHIRKIDDKLLDYTYTEGYEFFEGSRGGLDANGNPTAAMISEALNQGVGILNYCGHGLADRFGTGNFRSSNVELLTNYNKLPFIIAAACLNGNYRGQTCFAETWLRASRDGIPTGAVATVMSTVNQLWEPPMCGQDEMIRILTSSEPNISQTYGGIVNNGFIKMLDVYPDEISTFRTWLIFGDPSLKVRTAEPGLLTLQHEQEYPYGLHYISLTSPVEGARVIISTADSILSQGFIEHGIATLTLPPLQVDDTVFVLSSHTNYIPYRGFFTFDSSATPYLVVHEYRMVDIAGNDSSFPNYGDSVYLEIEVENIGLETAYMAELKLQTSDPYMLLLDTVTFIDSIRAGEIISLTYRFMYRIGDDIPDGHQGIVTIKMTEDHNSTYRHIHFFVNAPNLSLVRYNIDDSDFAGTVNGRLDFGETALLEIILANGGNAVSPPGNLTLQSENGILFVHDVTVSIDTLLPGESTVSVHRVTADPANQQTSYARIKATYQAGHYISERFFEIPVGEDIEDWETGDFTQFDWDTGSANPWIITDENTFEGNYSARSAPIGDRQTSTLSITTYASQSDSISFYYYVSSEVVGGSLMDYLYFEINDRRVGAWGGETGWNYISFPVEEGENKFNWIYRKDYTLSAGEDMAMIDMIRFPVNNTVPSSIPDNPLLSGISVFPNPVSSYLTIDMDGVSVSNAEACIYDIEGRLVKNIFLRNLPGKINMEDLPAGIFILKVSVRGKEAGNVKLIKN